MRCTSRCVATSLLARLGWLAQFGETLAIAPSALGSAHRLTAKRRTPFSPRAHYKLSIWCWAPRYSRWPRPHELGQLHDFYACLTRRYPSSLAIWLATRANVRAGLSCTPALGERRHRGLTRRLVAVCRRAILMIAKGQRPHPRRALRCRVHLHDADTTLPSASTSKSSSLHSLDEREAEARLRTR